MLGSRNTSRLSVEYVDRQPHRPTLPHTHTSRGYKKATHTKMQAAHSPEAIGLQNIQDYDAMRLTRGRGRRLVHGCVPRPAPPACPHGRPHSAATLHTPQHHHIRSTGYEDGPLTPQHHHLFFIPTECKGSMHTPQHHNLFLIPTGDKRWATKGQPISIEDDQGGTYIYISIYILVVFNYGCVT